MKLAVARIYAGRHAGADEAFTRIISHFVWRPRPCNDKG
jgi:hypothetical protein